MLASGGLANSNCSMGQFVGTLFQNSLAVSENNVKGISNSKEKLTWENLGFDKLQKSFIRLVATYEKSKQENSCMGSFIEKNLIIVGN